MFRKFIGFAIVVGGLLLFIIVSPFLIAAVWLLVTGFISFAILSFIVWAIWEHYNKGR